MKIVSYHTQGQVFESNYTEHKHYHVTLSIKPGSCTWKEIYSTTHRYMQNNDIQYMCVLLKTSQGNKACYVHWSFFFKWYDMNLLLPT